MKNENKPLVVVLSRNYSTGLSVIRSLGAAGYRVDLVASAFKAGNSKIAASSKYVDNTVEIVSRKVKDGDDEELLNALLAYKGKCSQKPVLFPTDDYTASVMDICRDQLDEIFIMPHIVGAGAGSLTEHMNKIVQGNMAKKAGIPTPKEWIIPLNEGRINLPENIVYPCFVKPIESITGYKHEMAICNNNKELYFHLKKLKKRFDNRSILVQEYLDIESEIDFSGVCLDDEIIIPAIIKKTNVAQYEKGVTLSGKVVPFEELDAELRESIINMLKDFHYHGMFDFELSVVGDKLYFNEVNLRSGGPNFSYFMSGVNLPALYVKEALGERHTPEEEKVKEYNKTFIYEKIAWEDHIKGFMSRRELKKCIDDADITLLCNDDDPVPGEIFTKQIKKDQLMSKLRVAKRFVKRNIRKCKRLVKKAIKPIARPLYRKIMNYPQYNRDNRRNIHSDKPRIMVAGRNYCSNLTMARSLGKAGYEVEILKIFQVRPKRRNVMKRYLKPDAYSKYIKGYYICVSRRRSRRIVKKLIRLADRSNKMLLIPADDLVAHIADQYYNKLSNYYLMPNVRNTQGAIGELMCKGVQKELAKNAGLPVLNSCVIIAENGEFEIPETVTYPCFMKPNVSRNSSKGRMRKCDTREELEGYLSEFSQNRTIEMLVEDFIEIDKEYSILGVSTKKGVNGPGFFVAEQGGHMEHRGVAVVGRTLPCDEEKELIDDILRFIESLKFDGLYDVDLIKTPDGKMYFVELNMRFGASGYAFTESGVNLPGMFADYMFYNKPIDLDCVVEETNKTFVSEKVLIEEYMMGRMTKKQLKSCMNDVDIHFIKNDDDTAAYKHFKKFFPIAAILRALYKLTGK